MRNVPEINEDLNKAEREMLNHEEDSSRLQPIMNGVFVAGLAALAVSVFTLPIIATILVGLFVTLPTWVLSKAHKEGQRMRTREYQGQIEDLQQERDRAVLEGRW